MTVFTPATTEPAREPDSGPTPGPFAIAHHADGRDATFSIVACDSGETIAEIHYWNDEPGGEARAHANARLLAAAPELAAALRYLVDALYEYSGRIPHFVGAGIWRAEEAIAQALGERADSNRSKQPTK